MWREGGEKHDDDEVSFRPLTEIDVLLELPLDAAAELEVSGAAELLLELLEVPRR